MHRTHKDYKNKKIPYELVSSVYLYKWFIKAEKFIPYYSDRRSQHMFFMCELAADIHDAFKREDYIAFKWLLLQFISKGKF